MPRRDFERELSTLLEVSHTLHASDPGDGSVFVNYEVIEQEVFRLADELGPVRAACIRHDLTSEWQGGD
jgi:hypothetical protein